LTTPYEEALAFENDPCCSFAIFVARISMINFLTDFFAFRPTTWAEAILRPRCAQLAYIQPRFTDHTFRTITAFLAKTSELCFTMVSGAPWLML
jgi:hypothetical protein